MTQKLLCATFVAIFCSLFLFIYKAWASPLYAVYGLLDNSNSNISEILAVTLLVTITILLPSEIKRYSDFAIWIIFILIFCPAVMSLSVATYESFSSWWAIINLTVSFLLVANIPRMIQSQTRSTSNFDRNWGAFRQQFYLVFFVIYFLLTFLLVVYYGNSLSFAATLEAVGRQRESAGEIGVGTIAPYAVTWLSNAFNPYLIASGLTYKNSRLNLLIGILGQILVYMTLAGKIILISTGISVLFALIISTDALLSSKKIAFVAAAIMMVLASIIYVFDFNLNGDWLDMVSLLYMRTFAIQGALVGVYLDFFSHNELTYGSHVGLISLFIHYPYNGDLALVIGRHLVGGAGFGANANFWATDGIATMGMSGIIPIGVIVGIAFGIADKVIPLTRLRFAILLSIPWLMSFANIPFFTSLVSAGGFILLLFLLLDPEQNPRQRVESNY